MSKKEQPQLKYQLSWTYNVLRFPRARTYCISCFRHKERNMLDIGWYVNFHIKFVKTCETVRKKWILNGLPVKKLTPSYEVFLKSLTGDQPLFRALVLSMLSLSLILYPKNMPFIKIPGPLPGWLCHY